MSILCKSDRLFGRGGTWLQEHARRDQCSCTGYSGAQSLCLSLGFGFCFPFFYFVATLDPENWEEL